MKDIHSCSIFSERTEKQVVLVSWHRNLSTQENILHCKKLERAQSRAKSNSTGSSSLREESPAEPPQRMFPKKQVSSTNLGQTQSTKWQRCASWEGGINLQMFDKQEGKYLKEGNCRSLHTSISGLNLSSNTAIAAKEPEPVRKRCTFRVFYQHSVLHLEFTLGQQKQSNMPSVTFKCSVSVKSRGHIQAKASVLPNSRATYYWVS